MCQSKWRFWKLSIFILLFLTMYNIFLTIKLMYASSCDKNQPEVLFEPIKAEPPAIGCSDKVLESYGSQPEISKSSTSKSLPDNRDIENDNRPLTVKYNLKLDLALGRSDDRMRYLLFDNVIVGDKFVHLTGLYKTSLATQSSLDKIASIIESSLHWGGPISLAIFAGSEKELNGLLMYIIYLRKCNVRIKERVSFHLAILKDKGPKKILIDDERISKMGCDDPIGVLKSLLKEVNKGVSDAHIYIKSSLNFFLKGISPWRFKIPYPQNVLRNLARKNCRSEYTFLIDVDIIPSKGMAESLNIFLGTQKCQGKCAYVVPTYELYERVAFPPDKTDLVRLANKGLARPFHHKVFIYNQYATNFSRWERFQDPDMNIRISHTVTNFEFLYEPFYIANDTVPPHDERFIGYGYTRNSQVYEMFVAGYEFLVLSPIFTCHWGLQVKKTRPPWREHQNNLNRRQFDQFKKEIFSRYNKDPLNMIKPKKKKN
ncbi:beta-1,4-glucuronyltransferase 1 isoform X2 [Dendroctonus ponderosae]|uniref:beta-1,4-glucuronyltransferase 1 isoform X2 n=1 Tax=Dendroctonus ponderosae TaxID=77166 RepID=UPI0020356995|nr:beta-1,4-glucuronyltransferase 1 isoform X2 [Dendroctonus ponderosae]XP_048524638.1 beta-1,4-glucuronyltransferase 1 isoform X2 [Dendroctonus ponderosae]XP_048524639.1 beta-1,4-glucuronyltransferase 1 isoform X2 [Dendroctonus ponderosae]XP_048524640.1 beta-1,4-glucuronyltransferase 1 isoform X2 [Dendroctonus ponderosae]XP_048524641.1 beta-1,4-glucuronyltransferase 1 isoform X2 [Dendroctonus ponderosae]